MAAAFGVTADEPKVNFGRIHDHIQQVIAALAPQDSTERFAALGVEVIKAEAKFVDRRTLRAGDRMIRARRFIIATGSKPVPFDIPGLADVTPFTAETIFENTRRPGHLVVVGGDAARPRARPVPPPARLGRDGARRRAPSFPTPIPSCATFCCTGCARRASSSARTRSRRASTRAAQVSPCRSTKPRPRRKRRSTPRHLLLLGARVPAVDELDLEKAGVRRDKKRPDHLQLGRNFKTTNGRVHAIGEAAGAAIGTCVACNRRSSSSATRSSATPRRSDAVFATVGYTDPELAEVGMSEPQAKEKLKDRYRVVRAAFAENDRARATRETYGLAKIVADRSGRILGAGVAGPSAGELISLFALAIAKSLTVADLKSLRRARTRRSAKSPTGSARPGEKDQKPGPWLERRLKLQRMLP